MPWPEQVPRGHGFRLRRRRRALWNGQPLTAVSLFGFCLVACYGLGSVAMVQVHATQERIPVGLRVRLMRPEVVHQRGPGIQPLLVRLDASGRVFVNARAVAWEDLAGELQKELNRRPPNWPVYVEGDPELEWKWPAHLVDLVRGLHAEVVLLTTRRR